jgi:hypothetical protein
MEDTIRTCIEEFVNADFMELFKAHLFEKNQDYIIYLCRNIHKTNDVAIILGHPVFHIINGI